MCNTTIVRKEILVPLFLIGIFLISSCNFLKEKPDRRVVTTIKFVDENLSNDELEVGILNLKNRYAKYGIYPKITRIEGARTFSLVFEISEPEQVPNKYRSAIGKLEFFPLYTHEKMSSFFYGANKLLKKDSLDIEEPIFDKAINDSSYSGGLLCIKVSDTSYFNTHLNTSEILNLLGEDKKHTKFLWGKENKEDGCFPLYAVKLNEFKKAYMDGHYIDKATQSYSVVGEPSITISMNKEGALLWEELTKKASEEGFRIAMVIDDIVYSAPAVHTSIAGGCSEITGGFTVEEARELAYVLELGEIPKIEILSLEIEKLE